MSGGVRGRVWEAERRERRTRVERERTRVSYLTVALSDFYGNTTRKSRGTPVRSRARQPKRERQQEREEGREGRGHEREYVCERMYVCVCVYARAHARA